MLDYFQKLLKQTADQVCCEDSLTKGLYIKKISLMTLLFTRVTQLLLKCDNIFNLYYNCKILDRI